MDKVMQRTGVCPVDFNHESPEHAQRWPEIYRGLREQCPVAWSEEHGGYWVTTRYDDIVRTAQNNSVFTNGKTFDPETMEVRGGLSIPPFPIPPAVPDETDAPEWEGYRKLLNRKFAPKAAEARRENARKYAAALLDKVIETGRMDLVNDFTSPLPAIVTMELLGFPLHEWRKFADPLHEMVYCPKTDPRFETVVAQFDWIRMRVYEEVERRRTTPGDDLLSYLVTEKLHGAYLDVEIIQQIVFNILVGGVDTTTALTSNVLLHLWQHPEKRQRLIDTPELMPKACEEFVRYFSPIHALARTAQEDATIGDQAIRKGDRILLAYSAGNRDPEIFENPDEIILDRFPNRHIGFGAGMHRCLGSFVARMMFETMLTEILTRIPDYAIDVAAANPYTSVAAVNGWIDMPATFTPGKKAGVDIGI